MKMLRLSMAFSCMIALSLLLSGSTANAQGEKHFVDIRVFGGININSLSTEGTSFEMINNTNHKRELDASAGFQFGGAITFGNHFYISPGVWYTTSTLETKLISDTSQFDFSNESTLSMISIPVRVGFRMVNPHDENILNLRIFGGITGHHVLSVKTKGDKEAEATADDFEKFFAGAHAGIGVDVLFLFLDTGYELGLTDFEKNIDKTRQNSFFVNLGVKFKL